MFVVVWRMSAFRFVLSAFGVGQYRRVGVRMCLVCGFSGCMVWFVVGWVCGFIVCRFGGCVVFWCLVGG